MLIIADTSALVALAAADTLSLLEQLFATVRVPVAVLEECVVPGKPGADRLQSYLQEKVMEVELGDLVVAGAGLGQGELEAMALYKRLHTDFLLIDDQRARRLAQMNGIRVVGSLGILLRAKESGLVREIRPIVELIRTAGLFYSQMLTDEVLHLAGER